jgi:large subunit ribosomal protein L21
VAPGDIIEVERSFDRDPKAGSFELGRVLLLGGDGETKVGSPVVEGARVTATAIAETRGPKLRIFKMKRRKGYRRSRGHRQDQLRVRIDEIVV